MASARITPSGAARLAAHSWPGNVRELKNVLERALVLSEGGEIDDRHLAMGDRPGRAPVTGQAVAGVIEVPVGGRSLKSVEAELVRVTLDLTRGNKSAAARLLGISRPTLHRMIAEHSLAGAR
jgi:DNA-binding NtrC family response regulator